MSIIRTARRVFGLGVMALAVVTGTTALAATSGSTHQVPKHHQGVLKCVWVVSKQRTGQPTRKKVAPVHYNRTRFCIKTERGPRGHRGQRGATGPAGPSGVAGPKGDTGATGPQGPKGEKGDTGAQGPKGDTGAQGPAGADGHGITSVVASLFCPAGGWTLNMDIQPFSVDVCNGVQGPKGDTGERGPMGPQGPEGDPGPKGDTGPAGPQGPKGDTGATGPQGPKGDPGPQGPAGPAGPQGPAGLNGSSISTVSNAVTSAAGAETTLATADCPLTPDPNDDPTARLFAISGGFDETGSTSPAVIESKRTADGHGWIAKATAQGNSQQTVTLTAYAYCG